MSASSQVIRINLSAAGELRIDWAFGYFHIVRFEDLSGVAILDGEISVALNGNDDDYVPLLYNNKIRDKCDRARIRWAAQPGRVAVLIVADKAENFALDTPNPKQLVVSSGGTSGSNAAVIVGTSAVQVAASNSSRQSVIVQNLGSAAIFVGFSSGVTVANGARILPGESYVCDKTTSAIFAISGTAGQDVRVLQEGV
jgi:hypothetical protein